jgi:predicted secreted hydrolase
MGVALDCAAAVRAQELSDADTGVTYWEGAVTYSGSSPGVGYLEMTGYAGAVKF